MRITALTASLLLLTATAAAQPEVADNDVDEDGDGWLGTSVGVSIRASHPRVLVSSERLSQIVDRMSGAGAREPYSGWFTLLRESEDGGTPVSMTGLALLYLGTGDTVYLDRFAARVPSDGAPSLDELYGVDLLFDELAESTLQTIMQRAGADADVFYYNSLVESQTDDYQGVSWGYHRAFGAAPALTYAGAFALTPLELGKDPTAFPFDALNYVGLAAYQLGVDGPFRLIERRIAGDPTYNDALAGSFGGMYDNIGYDTGEESYSINLVAAFDTLTGEGVAPEFLHDRYRGSFYQGLQYPHLVSSWESDAWCRRGGTEAHQIAKIWNTQTDWITQPREGAVALTASTYGDGRMQYYALEGEQPELCGAPYGGLEMRLLFFDDELGAEPPSTNPTAVYFSGPGLVATRSDWSNDAAFAVLIAGEGISRRYEDANSFLLGRKGHVVTHAGARIRFDPDNDRHHWFAIRSAAKNTLKIFDPDECFDIEPDGTTGALHSGPPLVDSDNFGGMIFETPISNEDGCFTTGWDDCAQDVMRSGEAFPLGLYERANVTKFEHVEGNYSYAVGDGAAAYTRKIDLYQRELVHLRPDDVFVLFDRVRAANPSFRKVWTIHTVDEPVPGGEPTDTGLGMRSFTDTRTVAIENRANATTLSVLFPTANRATVRGGDSVLARAPLRPAEPMAETAVSPADMPRWIELLAAGPDPDGSLVIEGDAAEGAGVSETITFSLDRTQDYVAEEPDEVADGSVVDADQAWEPNEWAGHMVSIACGGDRQVALITGNSATTLSGAFTACQAWQYVIFRYLANSANHWQRVTAVHTTDLDFDELVLSVPHYFDTVDASGRLWSFAPRTDGVADGYRKRADLGQWTLEVESSVPQELDAFLTVFALRDPGTTAPETAAVEGELVRGALVADRLLVFARSEEPLTTFSFSLPTSVALRALLFDAQPGEGYGCERSGPLVSCAVGGGGTAATASAMGVVELTLPAVAPFEDGGTGGAGGSAESPGAGADDEGGCGCRLGPRAKRPLASWTSLALLGLLGWRRRRSAARARRG